MKKKERFIVAGMPAIKGRPVPLADVRRFFEKVDNALDRQCWLWTGHTDRKGYGQFKWRGKARWAHRWIYELMVGPIEEGLTLHHKCGNPGCVRPGHLTPLTVSENTAEGNRRRNGKPAEDALPDDSADGVAPF